jgi:hypothetical protein
VEKLTEIRCTFKRKSKTDSKIRVCNHLCVKVYPGSSGETWCSRCNLSFEFEVNTQSYSRNIVRVQKIEQQD